LILAVNLGNTNVRVAVGRTHPLKDAAAYWEEVPTAGQLIEWVEARFGGDIWQDLRGCVIASVLPQKTDEVAEAIQSRSGVRPGRVDLAGCGLDLSRYQDTPGEDRVVCLVAALQLCPPPLVVVDFGTATTINVVDRARVFIGGAILPGVRIGLDALAGRTARLPRIGELSEVAPLIGVSTRDNLISGAVRGAAFAVEGYLREIKKEVGEEAAVIVTGGHAPAVLPYCGFAYDHRPDLLLRGLFFLGCGQEI